MQKRAAHTKCDLWVWEHVKEIIWYVGHYESHFRSIMESKLKSESREILRAKQKQLEKDEK
ncbi:MAG: hypothetical protein IKG87_08110, partial [Clostridia bacterium]|nr:hypothetical protein [Clostridia bacterium]